MEVAFGGAGHRLGSQCEWTRLFYFGSGEGGGGGVVVLVVVAFLVICVFAGS